MHGTCAKNPLSTASSRRVFLQGAGAAAGAFVLGCFIPFGDPAFAAGAPAQGAFDPNVFLKIGSDNTVTVICKHFEMGQGVTTGLATLVAEELEAPWSDMRVEFAPNKPAQYKNLISGIMGTGGTTSIANSWVQMRQVGAAARTMFVAAAAARWSVPASGIKVENGIVMHGRSGQRARFGELAADAMQMPVPGKVTLKPRRLETDRPANAAPRFHQQDDGKRRLFFRHSPAGHASRRRQSPGFVWRDGAVL